MNKFTSAIKEEATLNGSIKRTENGAIARDTTGNALLDFYAEAGSLRSRSEAEIIELFEAAWRENPLYALKALFLTRDVRGGRGERRTARILLKWLANEAPETVIKNFDNLLEMGRGDDFYVFVDTKAEDAMWKFMSKQIAEDIQNLKAGKPISLLAKWLKSENASSQETRRLAVMTAKHFGLTRREYRKMLSKMRNYLNVVEQKMSANEWKSIDYSAVPSRAMKDYRKAFKRHDPESFDTFIEKVEKGEEKINASTLFPYDLVEQYLGKRSGYYGHYPLDRVIEAQWKALPNYIKGENNVLVMADVSGSMSGRPMATSIGLALYFAERNKGAFEDLYMTFTTSPRYIHIKPGNTLADNIEYVERTGVGYSTNLEAAFNAVLTTCVNGKVPQEDVPKALVVVSDMEIDPFFRGHGLDFISEMARRFAAHGYRMPRVVLWNADARASTFHASYSNPWVTFASGQNASEFQRVLDGIELDPITAMMKALDAERYAKVIL